MPGRAGHRPDVSVLSTGHDVADARLHRICAALLRRGLSVEVVGLEDPRTPENHDGCGNTMRPQLQLGLEQLQLQAHRPEFLAKEEIDISECETVA